MKAVLKIAKTSLVLTAFCFINAGISYACTCIGPGDAKEALELSKAVFSGRVVKSNEYGAEVELETVWKGKFTTARVTVFNPAPNTSCSIKLKKGERYIVFSTTDKERGRVSYIMQICFPTSVLSKAEQTLKEIGEGTPSRKPRRRLKT